MASAFPAALSTNTRSEEDRAERAIKYRFFEYTGRCAKIKSTAGVQCTRLYFAADVKKEHRRHMLTAGSGGAFGT